MQMGAGQGSMFADGRKGNPQGNMPRSPNMPMAGPGPSRVQGQPQYVPPMTPNYPRPGTRMPSGQMQGGHPRGVPTSQPLANGRTMMADGRKPMMADGGMDSPAPIGGMPDDQDQGPMPGDGSAAPPSGGAMGMPPIIKPEAVAYHDQDQDCKSCMYFGQDGQCAVLQMQVSPDGGCNAFEPGGAPADQSEGMAAPGGNMGPDDGTSGSPSLS